LFQYSARKGERDLKNFPDDPSIPYDIAALEVIRNNKPAAYKRLKETIDKGFLEYWMFQLDPLFESLRNDETFLQMIAQMKVKVDERRRLIEEMDKKETQ
jgi:hypothetical protein